MKTIFLSIAAFGLSGCAHAQDEPEPSPLNEALGFFVGSCWDGIFSDGKSTDVQCFRSVYDGKFVRSNHMVEGARGPYGGETIFSWNKDSQTVDYTYWDTNGGMSRGVMLPKQSGLKAPDETYARPDGSEMVISSRWDIVDTNSWKQVVESTTGDSTKTLWTITYQRAALSFGPAPELKE